MKALRFIPAMTSYKSLMKNTFLVFLLLISFCSFSQINFKVSSKMDAYILKEPNLSSINNCKYKSGHKMILVGYEGDGLWKAKYSKCNGYVHENQLNITSEMTEFKIRFEQNKKTQEEKAMKGFKILKSKAKMRLAPNPISEVIYLVPANTKLKILPTKSDYIKVEFRGVIGYINSIYFDVSGIKPKYASISSSKSSGLTSRNNSVKPSNCSTITNIPGSSKPSLPNLFGGVKYAIIINKPAINGHVPAFNALSDYLNDMGFIVKYSENNSNTLNNICDEIWTAISFDYDLQNFSNIKWNFYSPCNDYQWSLTSNRIARGSSYNNPKSNFREVLREMYGYKKESFNSSKRITLPKTVSCYNESKLKQEFTTNGLDIIEGVYENTDNRMANYKLGLKKIANVYYLIYLSGAQNNGNWLEGEVKATLIPTANSQVFKAKWIMSDKSVNSNFLITFEKGIMNVYDSDKNELLYIKMFPTSVDNLNISKNSPSSGTGFAISTNGLIITNHHVIDGANSIKIRGIHNNFGRSYSANVIANDKKNDLALIKIDDPSFNYINNLPYTINTSSNVGEEIFVLGYPLRSSMGDEVKLTNGIISSKTGFQGDITSYQISAPIQPGNSGGPLFNSNGQLIGVVNAKHTGAENASYAIKSSYLMNLLDQLDYPPNLNKTNLLKGKSLSQQAQMIKKFVYIIEINQ